MSEDTLEAAWADTVIKKRLRTISAVDGGLAMLRAWTVYGVKASVRLQSSPQRPFQPAKLIVPAHMIDRWIVHDITTPIEDSTEEASWLSRPLSGSSLHLDTAPKLDIPPMRTGAILTLHVEYIGPNAGGEVFLATMIGASAYSPLSPKSSTDYLNFASDRAIPPGWGGDTGLRVVIALGERVLRFEERAGGLRVIDSSSAVTMKDQIELREKARPPNQVGVLSRRPPVGPPLGIVTRPAWPIRSEASYGMYEIRSEYPDDDGDMSPDCIRRGTDGFEFCAAEVPLEPRSRSQIGIAHELRTPIAVSLHVANL